MLKFAKTKAKTSFTNLRRSLLVAIDEDDVSKKDIKFRLVTLENAMNEVMELISEIVLESREDEAALYNISEEAGELEKQYTDAVTRASTVLAELSNYNSARTSEVTGVRYTRDPEKVRAYLASVSQAVRTVAQPGPADVQQLDAFSRTTNDTSPNATVKNDTVPRTGAHTTNGVKHEAADPQPTMSASTSSRQVQSKMPRQLPATDLDGPVGVQLPPASTLPYGQWMNPPVSTMQTQVLPTGLPPVSSSMRYSTAPAANGAPPVQRQNTYTTTLPQPQMTMNTGTIDPSQTWNPVSSAPYHPYTSAGGQLGHAVYGGTPMMQPASHHTSAPYYASPDVYRHLKKIEIPMFSGQKTMYDSWRTAFRICVDQQPLSPELKLLQLRQYLSGQPLATIETYGFSAGAYAAALDRLDKKYGGEKRKTAVHMEALHRFQPIRDQGTASEFERFADLLQVAQINLQDVGRQDELGYGTFCTQMQQKLSPELLTNFLRWRSERGKTESIPTLLQWLEQEAEFRTAADETLLTVSKTNHVQRPIAVKQQKLGPSSASSLVAPTSSKVCVFCQDGHDTSACTVVTDVRRRKQILMKSGRCFLCLKLHHRARNCTSQVRCGRCQQRHHIVICEGGSQKPAASNGYKAGQAPVQQQQQKSQSAEVQQQQTQRKGDQHSSTTAATVNSGGAILLQTAKAIVMHPGSPEQQTAARIILDGGSQRSYVTSAVLEKLRVTPNRQERLAINTFGGKGGKNSVLHDVAEVAIRCLDGSAITLEVIVVPSVCPPVQNQHPVTAAAAHDALSQISLADNSDGSAHIDMLLGADIYWQVVTGEIIRTHNGPTAIATRIGWVLSGPSELCASAMTASNLVSVNHVNEEPLTKIDSQDKLLLLLCKFWQLESIGITPQEPDTLQMFRQTIQYDGHRYTARLPWREIHRALPDNYSLSQKRLQATVKKLRKTPEILQEYDSIIREQMQLGIVEEVPAAEDVIGEVHYLPHHPVIRHDKQTTKVRVVYDASSKVGSHPSLNECLHTGPPMLEHIPDILIRFRINKVAITADIEKAFLMVGIGKEDRDALRFLWLKDVHSEQPEVVALRFARVVFGVTASPFLLNATILHHLSNYQERDAEFVQKLLKSLYVDDVTGGGGSDEEAHEFYVKARTRLAEGGFNLRKFMSNSKQLMSLVHGSNDSQRQCPSIVSDQDTFAKATLNSSPSTRPKVLGIQWDPVADTLVMDLAAVLEKSPMETVTKRDVLAATAKMYDPLGLLCPVIVRLKIFFQELCRCKRDWDDPLQEQHLTEWKQMVGEMKTMEPVFLQRWYFSDHGQCSSVTVHGFCDASNKAYAAVVYFVWDDQVQLVAAKSRVAPVAKQSIPRLELLSALILARLVQSVTSAVEGALTVKEVQCWSDSQVALAWIVGEHQEWKQFVQNRVTEIRRIVPPSAWRYCPTSSNPADLPSRGVKPGQLLNTIWFTGPNWLPGWTSEQQDVCDQPENDDAVKAELKKSQPTSTLLTVSQTPESNIGTLIDINRFSDSDKLLRVTALVLTFVDRLKKRLELSQPDVLARAESVWLKDVQRTAIQDSRFSSWHKQFGIYEDDSGILRCKGRLENAAVLTFEQKHPALLHTGHRFTDLIVLRCHRRVLHNGVKDTLTELRSAYWIVRGRQHVRKIVGQCAVCNRLESRCYAPEDTPPLPEFRTKVDFPFSYVGVDFAGPLYVKEGAEMRKVYIALYTCAVSRAVHLDLVLDLSADTFLRCFKRFTARFGVPKHITSDNAKTFKSASKSLASLFALPEVVNKLSTSSIKWSFNLEKAPWWGGFYERLVGSVKRCLRKVVGNARLTYEEMLTVLLEVEAVLNSRPLTFVSTEDLDEPLTPSHMIYGRRVWSCPAVDTEDVADASVQRDDLLRRLNHLTTIVDHFWSRWSKEYLLELRNSHRRVIATSGAKVSAGDVVVVHEENEKRASWKLALVQELLIGKDGKARGAVIKCASRGGRPSTMRRPVQRLYPVEIGSDSTTPKSALPPSTEAVPVNTSEPTRPMRATARVAADARQRMIRRGDL